MKTRTVLLISALILTMIINIGCYNEDALTDDNSLYTSTATTPDYSSASYSVYNSDTNAVENRNNTDPSRGLMTEAKTV